MSKFVLKRKASKDGWIKQEEDPSPVDIDMRVQKLQMDPQYQQFIHKIEEDDSPTPRKRRKINYAEDLDDSDSDFRVSNSDISYRSSATSTSDEEWDDEDDNQYPKEIKIKFKDSSFLTCKYPVLIKLCNNELLFQIG